MIFVPGVETTGDEVSSHVGDLERLASVRVIEHTFTVYHYVAKVHSPFPGNRVEC